jgi:hypothetical protein
MLIVASIQQLAYSDVQFVPDISRNHYFFTDTLNNRDPWPMHVPGQCTIIHTKNPPKTTFSSFYISTTTSLFALKFKN